MKHIWIIGLLYLGCGDTTAVLAPTEPLPPRLTTCATYADAEWLERKYYVYQQTSSGLPCSDSYLLDRLTCSEADQNARYLALQDLAYIDGWSNRALVIYRRCMEREL